MSLTNSIKKFFERMFFVIWLMTKNTPFEFLAKVFTVKNADGEIIIPPFFLNHISQKAGDFFPSGLHPRIIKADISINKDIEKEHNGINLDGIPQKIFFTDNGFQSNSIVKSVFDLIILLMFSRKNLATLTTVSGVFASGALTNKVSENVKTISGFIKADRTNIENKMQQSLSHLIKSSADNSTWVMRDDFQKDFLGEKTLKSYLGRPVICRSEENFLSKDFPVVLIDFPRAYAIRIKRGAVKKTKKGFEFWLEIYGSVVQPAAMKSLKV